MLGIITAGMLAACKDPEISKFEYESRGMPGSVVYNLIINFDKRILITKETYDRIPSFPKPKIKKFSLNSEQIAELKKTLNMAGVTGWKDNYENQVCVFDGTFWVASYVLSNGKSRKIHGDNNWPIGIKTLSTALKKMGIELITSDDPCFFTASN